MIRFSKYIWLYFLISACIIVPGVFSLAKWGFKPSIDFAGGALIEVKFAKNVTQQNIEEIAQKKSVPLASVQGTGLNTFILRTKIDDVKKVEGLLSLFNASSVSAEIVRQEEVGPVIGKELLSKAIVAAIIAIIAILAYVAYAFKNGLFGFAAIISLLHDLLVMLGCFSLFGHFYGVEVDTLFVTAFLTTMSFSVHDTIVILDRIREYQKRGGSYSLEELSDRAVTETMGRSLANSMTIIIMLVALSLMGGSTIHWFSIGLLIGTVTGTYSSPFIAVPALLIMNSISRRKKNKNK